MPVENYEKTKATIEQLIEDINKAQAVLRQSPHDNIKNYAISLHGWSETAHTYLSEVVYMHNKQEGTADPIDDDLMVCGYRGDY